MSLRFTKPEKHSALTGETVITWWTSDNLGRITASRRDVSVHGDFSIEDWEADGNEFARALTLAWKEHLKLMPKLTQDIPVGLKL